MVWFYCDLCTESFKKPKLTQHLSLCHTQCVTCQDCNCSFDRQSAHSHNTCITEEQKYHGKQGAAGARSAKAAYASSDDLEAAMKEARRHKPPYFCQVCKTKFTGLSPFALHLASKKHVNKTKRAAEASAPAANSSAESQPKRKREQESESEGEEKKKKKKKGSKVKWKAVIVELLEEARGELKLKKLKQKVFQKAAELAPERSDTKMEAIVDKKLANKDLFKVMNGKVFLKNRTN